MQYKGAVRHQLVTAEQRYVYDYWESLCDGDGHPTRQDLDPMVLHRHLPFISLYERAADGRFAVRLAGTGFWQFFGTEIQGRAVADLPMGEGCAYWTRVLDGVERTGRASAGVTRPHTPRGAGLQQHWLRLPLFGEDGGMVLGFDQFLKSTQTSGVSTGVYQPSPLARPAFVQGVPMLA